ncbi:MAG: hypothetical protein M1827_005924 [Pycnora praestabilis]|nr:MAG: hypothetical protein M1827_005924 [Pycnora praestabilis]
MPRNGDGSSDNAISTEGGTKAAGVPQDPSSEAPTSSGIDRSAKAAPMPDADFSKEGEVMLSGGGSQGKPPGGGSGTGGSGKGGKDVAVDQIAEGKTPS